MGAEAGKGLQIAGTIKGGLDAAKAGKDQALRSIEATKALTAQKRKDLDKFKGKQELGFLSSGVLLEGSPLLALQETEAEGAADIRETREAGFKEAHAARRAGRDALVGSLFQAGSAGASMAGGGQ